MEYEGGEWYGSLFWYWSFKYKNQGFVTFNVAETSETEKKLNLTGGFYVIEKSNGSSNWTIKHKMEIDRSNQKTLDKSNFDSYFPKPYWYTRKGGFDKYYWSNWKFIKASWDLDNICTNTGNTNKCPERSIGFNSETFSWEWSGGDWYDRNCFTWTAMNWCDYVWSWSSNKEQDETQSQWWNYMYKNGMNILATRLMSFKGYWRPL